MQPLIVLVGSLASLVVGVACAVFIPGIERKVHARIQQRFGPPLTTPGFWNILKFSFKERVKPNSPNPAAYHSFIIIPLMCVAAVLLFSTPFWWGILGFSSILGLVGLLKVEEVSYVFMGSFSRSVMSVGMPWADITPYASFRNAVRRYFEEFGAVRALKMITFGSFPFYVALFLPFAVAGSISVPDVVHMQNPAYGRGVINLHPVLFSVSGLLAAFVYFIGFNIITNNRPFDIIKPKVDIIEGPLLEYAAVWRGLYYLLMGFLSFTLSSLFVTLFVGIPFDVRFPFVMLLHLILVVILPVCSAVLRAFSPVFTFKQIYFVSFTSTMLGVIALVLSAMGV